MGSIYLATASYSGGSTSSETLERADDVYASDLGDTGFWRSVSDPFIPRQRVFNTVSTGSSPHTLRRPQSRQRPYQDLGHLRGGSVAQHTNCVGVFGALHASTAIASGNVSHTSVHSKDRLARSLAPATRLIHSLNITNAYDERRRQHNDEDMEWKKRFWLNRTLQKREEAIASRQKVATRAMRSVLSEKVHDYDAGRSCWGGNIRTSPIQHLQRQTNPLRQVVYTDHTIPWGLNGSSVISLGGIQKQAPHRLSPLAPSLGEGAEEIGFFSSSVGSFQGEETLQSQRTNTNLSPSPVLSRTNSSSTSSSRSSQRSRSPGRPAGDASMQLDGVFERVKPPVTSLAQSRSLNIGRVTVLKDMSRVF